MIDVGGASGQVGRHGRRHQRRAPLHIAATCGQRISGPNRLDSVVTQWVSLIAGGRDAHCSTTPQGSPAAAERSMMSLSSHRNSDGPRGFVPVGPQWWPDTSRVSSARVTATYNSRRSSSTRRRSSRRRCSEILSDNCFRSATADVSSTGMPCAPAEARSPRSSGGSSAGSVSQLLRDTVDGNTPRDRCATATTCHSKPLAACTVSTWTRSQATVNSAGGKPFSTTSRRPNKPAGPQPTPRWT